MHLVFSQLDPSCEPNCALGWQASSIHVYMVEISVMMMMMMIVLLCTLFDVRFICGGRVDLKILPIGRQPADWETGSVQRALSEHAT